jgi:sigma-B regulation protein RsbU (phosphoserine phosphatase)
MDSNTNKAAGMESQEPNQTTIMVVVDDPLTLEAVSAILKEEGYIVHCASDGRSCLESARQKRPDLILLDVVRPDSDGVETCRKLSANPTLQTIPVIFMISDSNIPTLEAVYNSGACDFIRKPLNRIELLSRIDLLLKLYPTMEKGAEAEKLKGVLETAGGVCHSLNQPLQYVLGAVQILLMDMSPEDKMYKSLDMIREKVEQMGTITRKLAEVTRYRTKPHAGGRHILDIDKYSGKY